MKCVNNMLLKDVKIYTRDTTGRFFLCSETKYTGWAKTFDPLINPTLKLLSKITNSLY